MYAQYGYKQSTRHLHVTVKSRQRPKCISFSLINHLLFSGVGDLCSSHRTETVSGKVDPVQLLFFSVGSTMRGLRKITFNLYWITCLCAMLYLYYILQWVNKIKYKRMRQTHTLFIYYNQLDTQISCSFTQIALN